MSVFSKPFEEQEAHLNRYKRAKDNAVFLHFFARCYESVCSRLTPEGNGNTEMFRRMPEYFFNVGPFGVFERDGEFHAWKCGGIDGINEYGYPTGYFMVSANGKVDAGRPIVPDGKDVIRLDAGDVVIFRPNRLNVPIFSIVAPILYRMSRTIRAIDNVTGKRGLSLYATPDSTAKSVIDKADEAVEDGVSMLALKNPDLGTSSVRSIPLFGETGALTLSDLWESLRHYEATLWETVGENTVAFEKKERLNIPEVESNNERIANGIFGVARSEMEKGLAICRERWADRGVDWHLPEIKTEMPDEEPEDKPDEEEPGETEGGAEE